MRKHRKKSTPSVAIYALVLFVLAATLWFNNHQNNVLGTSISGETGLETGSGSGTGGGEQQPTGQIIQLSPVPTTQAPNDPPPTTVIFPTETPQNPPIPTPSLIVPSEPVYVEIIDAPGGGGGTGGGGGEQVDIGAGPVTVVIENTPSGVTTTTEYLTPQTTVVGSISTVITAQSGQNTAVTPQSTSTLDRLFTFFTGNSTSQNDSSAGVATPKAPMYAQIYMPNVSGATFVTDPTETISALNLWLGFNGITLKYLGDGSFSITQGDVEAIINPKDSKIAINLSRMEMLVNTETGFQPLSYLPFRVTEYLIAGGHISKLSAPIKVVETPTELHLEMETTSTQYLFALIPVPVNVKYCMSATTLNPCGKEQGLLSKSLDFLSL